MKKLIIILFTFLSLNSFSQNWYEMRGPLWIKYQNGATVDSVKIYFSGTSVSFSTSKQQFNFTDPIITPTIDISGGYVGLANGFSLNTSAEGTTGNLWINYNTGLILDFYENELTIAPITSFTNSITAPGYFTPTDTMETVDALRDSVNMLLDSIADLNSRTTLSQQITSDDTTRWGSGTCILNVSASMSNIISSYYTNTTLYAFCNTEDVSYTWSGPGSFSSNDKTTLTSISGLYRVITDKAGCTSDTSEIYVPGLFANNGVYWDLDTLKSTSSTSSDSTWNSINVKDSLISRDGNVYTSVIPGSIILQENNQLANISDEIWTFSDGADSIEIIPFRIRTTGIFSQKKAGIEVFKTTTSGKIDYTAGTSSTFVRVSGILKTFSSDVTTSGTGETDLYSYTLPANVLGLDNDIVTFEVFLDFTSLGANNGTVKFYFGANSLTVLNAIISGYRKVIFEITRVSSSVCRITCWGSSSSGEGYSQLTSQDFTTTNVIKITGQAAGGSFTPRTGVIKYLPAGIN